MRFYLLYKIGQYLALLCPVKISYWIAERLADIKHSLSKNDAEAVKDNLSVILGPHNKKIEEHTKQVFRNFAKYLVDFFRFEKIDEKFVHKNVKIYGKEHLEQALKNKKGVILVTAHIGNWELGGIVAAISGYKMHAVALDHKNPRIDRLFKRQRESKGVTVIPTGVMVRRCFNVLKNNGILALLGDRNFSNKGIKAKFFGKETPIPIGPAYLSLRFGSPIVPTFFIRLKQDKFMLFFEKPIDPKEMPRNENAEQYLTDRYLRVIERVIRAYPDQWYVFRRFWEVITSWQSEF